MKLVYQGRLRRKRQEYKKAIDEAKRDSWREFVKESANLNPYGFAYKLAASTLRNKNIMTTLKHGDTQTTGNRETLQVMLDKLVPLDTPETDGPEHLRRREVFPVPLSQNLEIPFSMEEVNVALDRTKKRRAPGSDLVPSEIYKNLDEPNKEILQHVFNVTWTNGYSQTAGNQLD